MEEQNLLEGKEFEYPYPLSNQETYAEYRARVDVLIIAGFGLCELSWAHYNCYCKGGGNDKDQILY